MNDSKSDRGGTGRHEQLLLDLTRDPALSRDDLVATPANRSALALVDSWPNWSSPIAVLHGAEGSGKSHLAAIWKDKASARAADPAAVDGGAIEHAMVGGAILIEDLDSHTPDQTGLFHLINAIRQGGGSLLVTARTSPSGWRLTLPDLVSRLRSVSLAEIGPPDDMLLEAVLVKLFSDRQISLDPAVVTFLMPRIERSLSATATLVERIDRRAMAQRSAVTRPLVVDVLRSMQQSGQEEPGTD
ncbi:HdaA/DnaA family protein [Notoacmeibacter ruber]|uniref:Hda lid domain-containing protein n=1 Tax=Notoacmeibacter ruber TaxID=2670375 RepID=A0A3L7JAL1_9HYPH|nr:hypothetical protein [Notoacmeibacter ruber]RLQ87666.1 hypothetical protein D8780_05050 [Notoacmeibacter ruber]